MNSKLAQKKNGIHYTPERLAHFLADQIWQYASQRNLQSLRVLDPACGDGRLLKAMIERVPKDVSIEVTGFETDACAVDFAEDVLSECASVTIRNQDFLDHAIEEPIAEFDIVITNPPYVRTQNLGADRTEKLRTAFGLTGRLDLYQAFTIAATSKLRVGGTLGLLTSNRFMYVQSGESMRRFLLENYDLKQLYDFGDTKLFKASVLPVVLIGNRSVAGQGPRSNCRLVRVYESNGEKNENEMNSAPIDRLFDAVIEDQEQSYFQTGRQRFKIESGVLQSDSKDGSHWSLRNQAAERFRDRIKKQKLYSFGDIAEIKVGIKTTADSVFIRADWEELAQNKIPESDLLRPLITHHICQRWKPATPTRKVLYPYRQRSPRQTVDLDQYPNAQRYLLEHADRLKSRKYLSKSNREWYEIWVPQVPVDWALPKIVWPDISERPNFSLDVSGAIVNGDCYWIKLNEDFGNDWLYLMLAVANSNLAVGFYDTHFHNKLYSGRRRFMTQYVKQFPLPDLDREDCQRIVELVKQNLNSGELLDSFDHEIDGLVSSTFGK